MQRFEIYLSVFLIISFNFFSCNSKENPTEPLGRTINPDHQVTIYDGDETVTVVYVALARTASERRTGLMDVHELPFDTGMLFLYDDERLRSFWMANTPLSLDMLFLNRNREIVHIRRNTTPYSKQSISSKLPAQYVLEVNAGFVWVYDIRKGMRMDWELDELAHRRIACIESSIQVSRTGSKYRKC